MRKVDPKFDIPVKELTDEAIQKRLVRFEGRKVNNNTAQQLISVMNGLFERTNIDVKRDLDFIYKAIDRYMEVNISNHLVCRAGCGYCCAVPVDVSIVEAARISLYLKKELRDDPLFVAEKDKNQPCPFLGADSKCSVYPVRPIVCRLFGSFDSWHPCRDGKRHYIHSHASQDMFRHLEDFFIHVSSQVPLGTHEPVQDIRAFFNKEV